MNKSNQRSAGYRRMAQICVAAGAFGVCLAGLQSDVSGYLFSTDTQLTNAQNVDEFGRSVADAGDVNGDGFDDVIVGGLGEAQVYLGSASGISATPAWSTTGPAQATANFGFDVNGVGDVNGDGFDDVIVGDPGERAWNGTEYYSDGAAYIYQGSASGLSSTPTWTVDETRSYYGSVVAGAGDVNGDGFDDVLVSTTGSVWGANNCQNESNPLGAVHLYLGSAAGVSTSASWQQSGEAGSCFGHAATGIGDVDGDGFDDIGIGAWTHGWGDESSSDPMGRAYVFRGSASGMEASASWSQPYPDSTAQFAIFGWSLAGGDVNGDGYDDLIVPAAVIGDAPEENTHIYFGSSTGLTAQPQWFAATPGSRGVGFAEVAVAGDVNADGFDDILLPHGMTPDEDRPLYLWLLHGSLGGPIQSPAWGNGSPSQGSFFEDHGHSSSGAGDVNGDGFDDIVYLVWDTRARTFEVFVYYGGQNPAPTADPQSVSVEQGMSVDIVLSGSDPYEDDLIFAVESQPTHGELGELDILSGELTYQPEGEFVGTDSFEFSAADPYGNTDTATVDIAVTNEAPVFVEPTPGESLQVEAGSRLSFQVAAEDADGDRITYSVDPTPARASIDVLSGEFSWHTTAEQVGEHELEFSASDSYQATTHTIDVRVHGPGGEDAGPGDAGEDAGADAETPDTGAPDAGSDDGDAAADTGPDGTTGPANGSEAGSCGCTNASGPSNGLAALLVLIGCVGLRRRQVTPS